MRGPLKSEITREKRQQKRRGSSGWHRLQRAAAQVTRATTGVGSPDHRNSPSGLGADGDVEWHVGSEQRCTRAKVDGGNDSTTRFQQR